MSHFLRQLLRIVYALFLSLDLLASAVTGGGPWETLSARAGKARRRGRERAIFWAGAIDWAALHLFGEANHCESSIAAYEARLKAVAP